MAAIARDNVAATGDQRINGLLTGLAWASPVVSYGFPTQRSDYESGYADPAVDVGLAPLSLGQQQAFRQMAEGTKPFPGGPTFTYGSVESFTNLSLDEAVPSSADIRLAVSGLPTSAYAYYPTLVYPLMTTPPEAGDQFFTTGFGDTPVMPGNKVWHMHLHEFGHSLGLKHAHEAGGIAGGPVPTAFDSLEFTAMTYRPHVGASAEYGFPEPEGNPQTFMMLDIAALQHVYGADFSTNSGNTTYSWNPATGEMSVNGVAQGAPSANRVFLTVWDGGGTDTYDMSNYGGGTSIDLAPGGSSVTSLEQRALLNYADVVFNGAAPIYARGTVFNALQHNGDLRSLIENAIGGSGNDAISGNDAANVLSGGDGADTIAGGRGYDQMTGGAGADVFAFSIGDGGSLPHDVITDFQVGTDKLLLPDRKSVV